MNFAEWLPAVTTAFFAGLLGAGHCFGMCGGIASGLGMTSARGRATGAALVFNISRVFSYSLLGGVAALILGLGGEFLTLPVWSHYLRWLTAALIFMIGLQFLFDLRILALIERGGARIWKFASPMVQRAASTRGYAGKIMLGLAWGLLPCGLVYTILLTAASSGEFAPGFVIMASFGIGTLPALLGMTLWAPALSSLVQDKLFRKIIGAALILLALWSVVFVGTPQSAHVH